MPVRSWLEKIRIRYDMPFLERNMRVDIEGRPGKVTGGNQMMKIRIRLDSGECITVYPTYHTIYYQHDGEVIARYQ